MWGGELTGERTTEVEEVSERSLTRTFYAFPGESSEMIARLARFTPARLDGQQTAYQESDQRLAGAVPGGLLSGGGVSPGR